MPRWREKQRNLPVGEKVELLGQVILETRKLGSIKKACNTSGRFRHVAFLVLTTLALVASQERARAEMLPLGRSWHFLRIDQPCSLTNKGTKLTVFNIVNPKTGRWELVWGAQFWRDSWVGDYLRFDGNSDDVHNGGKLRILQPVTIAIVVFGDGQTEVEIDKLPAVHITRKTGPAQDTKPDEVLQPRTSGTETGAESTEGKKVRGSTSPTAEGKPHR